jgi:hypothetical protein
MNKVPRFYLGSTGVNGGLILRVDGRVWIGETLVY